MAANYTLEQVGEFIVSERLAVHGLNPEAHAQNVEIVSGLNTAGREASHEVLGVQVIGSRSNGTSVVGSDLDLAFITLGSRWSNEHQTQLVDISPFTEAVPAGITVDDGIAAQTVGIQYEVPDDASWFTDWVLSDPERTIGIFEKGVLRSSQMRLLQSAVLSTLMARSPDDAHRIWGSIRQVHAATYAGDARRMRQKIWERLDGVDSLDVVRVFDDQKMLERRKMFKLPLNILCFSRKIDDWIEAHEHMLKGTKTYDFYRDLQDEIRV